MGATQGSFTYPNLRWRRPLLAFLLIIAFLPACAIHPARHSGGTDSAGCHRDSSTGLRHCHGGGSGGGRGTGSASLGGLGYAGIGVGLVGLGALTWWLLGGHSWAKAKCGSVAKEDVCWPLLASWMVFGLGMGMSITGTGLLIAD